MSDFNLLFLFTDEQRYDTLATYGNTIIETPNIDELAEAGTAFERAYCTQAVCTPSRASIMTGLFPHSCNVPYNNYPLAADYPSLVELADFSTYTCGYHGKWHLGDEVFAQHGFSDWVSIEDAMYRKHFSRDRPDDAKSSYYHWLVSHGFSPTDQLDDGYEYFSRTSAARFPEQFSKPAYLAETSCEFLRRNRDNPFVLYVNFLEPHMPFFGPRDSMYDETNVPLPPCFGLAESETLVPHAASRAAGSQFKRAHLGGDSPSASDYRALLGRYWGLVSQVDTAVGRILSVLQEEGLSEKTVVVFTSDHGDMMGEHNLLTKGVQYEGSVRVPLIIRAPGTTPRRIMNPVSLVDLVPTLLELLGKQPTRRIDGRTISSAITAGTEPEHDVVIEWNEVGDKGAEAARGDIRTLVTKEGWKLSRSELGYDELFHLFDDPCERENLIRAQPDIADSLSNRLAEWQDHAGDHVVLPALR